MRALGQIGDRRAVRPIARLIEGDDLPRGVPYIEVGEALGRLGQWGCDVRALYGDVPFLS